jgi:hypothetical protein
MPKVRVQAGFVLCKHRAAAHYYTDTQGGRGALCARYDQRDRTLGKQNKIHMNVFICFCRPPVALCSFLYDGRVPRIISLARKSHYAPMDSLSLVKFLISALTRETRSFFPITEKRLSFVVDSIECES